MSEGDCRDIEKSPYRDDCEISQVEDCGFPCRKCGKHIERYVRDGLDVNCDHCGQTHNCFGQQIDHPQGQGEDYTGERWDDDY